MNQSPQNPNKFQSWLKKLGLAGFLFSHQRASLVDYSLLDSKGFF
jgi:hypothetical protein